MEGRPILSSDALAVLQRMKATEPTARTEAVQPRVTHASSVTTSVATTPTGGITKTQQFFRDAVARREQELGIKKKPAPESTPSTPEEKPEVKRDYRDGENIFDTMRRWRKESPVQKKAQADQAAGEHQAKPPKPPQAPKPFDFLKDYDPVGVARVIEKEGPQTLATILSNSSPDVAANVLSQLPEETRAEVTGRMKQTQTIAPDVLETLTNLVRDKTKIVPPSSKTSPADHTRRVIEKLSTVDVQNQEGLSFEDIFEEIEEMPSQSHLSKGQLATLLEKAQENKLSLADVARALRTTRNGVRETVLNALPQYKRDELTREYERIGPQNLEEGQKIQDQLANLARQVLSQPTEQAQPTAPQQPARRGWFNFLFRRGSPHHQTVSAQESTAPTTQPAVQAPEPPPPPVPVEPQTPTPQEATPTSQHETDIPLLTEQYVTNERAKFVSAGIPDNAALRLIIKWRAQTIQRQRGLSETDAREEAYKELESHQ